jgi:hypothetical protein
MHDGPRLFSAVLVFRSTAPQNKTVLLRRRFIRASDLDAAGERARALGRQAPPDLDGSWVFAGIHAITEIEPWQGEGIVEFESHVRAELDANPFPNLSGSD